MTIRRPIYDWKKLWKERATGCRGCGWSYLETRSTVVKTPVTPGMQPCYDLDRGIVGKSKKERATARRGRGLSQELYQSQQGRRSCSKLLTCAPKSVNLSYNHHLIATTTNTATCKYIRLIISNRWPDHTTTRTTNCTMPTISLGEIAA